MKGNYNNVATFYDRLSRFIFGDAIVNAQKLLVQSIDANSTILIIGGGTGWILEEIAKKHSEGLHITYVEISEKMIALSKKRDFGSNKVIFINKSIQDIQINQRFDIVITPFLLDNFSTGTTNIVFGKVHQCLLPDGLWLFADFQLTKDTHFWQKTLLKTMYFFFKFLCGIEANRLPDTNTLFEKYQYKKLSSKSFFKNFICSLVYKKHG
ncbi:MAG: hypothetical protein JWQ09_3398 [Segetibacter sp.]|nr:hypothetical protein [Segetibacter sp.]